MRVKYLAVMLLVGLVLGVGLWLARTEHKPAPFSKAICAACVVVEDRALLAEERDACGTMHTEILLDRPHRVTMICRQSETGERAAFVVCPICED